MYLLALIGVSLLDATQKVQLCVCMCVCVCDIYIYRVYIYIYIYTVYTQCVTTGYHLSAFCNGYELCSLELETELFRQNFCNNR